MQRACASNGCGIGESSVSGLDLHTCFWNCEVSKPNYYRSFLKEGPGGNLFAKKLPPGTFFTVPYLPFPPPKLTFWPIFTPNFLQNPALTSRQ